jgi:hypothetical protein
LVHIQPARTMTVRFLATFFAWRSGAVRRPAGYSGGMAFAFLFSLSANLLW